MWHRDCSFSELDQRCEPIQRGLYRTDEINVSPVIVVVAHPSFAFSAHAKWPRTFDGQQGETAEIALLRDAWQMAQVAEIGRNE